MSSDAFLHNLDGGFRMEIFKLNIKKKKKIKDSILFRFSSALYFQWYTFLCRRSSSGKTVESYSTEVTLHFVTANSKKTTIFSQSSFHFKVEFICFSFLFKFYHILDKTSSGHSLLLNSNLWFLIFTAHHCRCDLLRYGGDPAHGQ